ncbi:Phosphoglycerol transferase MdoB [Desulfuromusa kysingii]|uniref:Phosphoglycerol transferase MdoB n=1 Tax=Desulfuromusa kysingii TaxID=37625 RepID=A0A1H4ATW7_9BACT|nr:LTA synthase family protein [Desulfuromusa kysingii]SEA39092.1 Phosphoglycerol transferase MdoB [Desulfuromusa kysingii]
MKSSRFQLLLGIYAFWTLLFFSTRFVLLFLSWGNITPTAYNFLEIFTSGWIFDSAFYAYAMIPAVLYLCLLPQRIWTHRWHAYWLKLILFSTIYSACFIAVAEYFFWQEFSVRFNFISIDYLIYRREVTDNIVQSYPVVLIFSALFFVALLLYQPLASFVQRSLRSKETFSRRCLIATSLLLLPLTVFFTINQDLRNISANTYTKELASNGPYQFVAAFRNNELDFQQFYTSLSTKKADTLIRKETAEPNSQFISQNPFDIRREISRTGAEKRSNVILITVESLSSDFLGYFGNHKHLTPNLDALIKKSLFFDNFYATGTRTTRGLEAITLSIPPTPGRSIIKRIGRETDLWSLGNVLDTKGYHSYFLYGGRGYFENMNAFFSGNGYQIVDQSSVADAEIHFSNAWGMADEDLYQQAIKVADHENQQETPFFLHLMTTSNHRPYTYPEGRIDIPSGKGRDGAVKYTDYAIGKFIQDAAEKPWFENTIFVIVADHQAGSAGKQALPIERYHIPLWIYAPQQIQPAINNSLASQIDLAPTLLGLLNMSYRSCFFGRDILLTPPKRALIANYQNLGLYDGHQLAILKPQEKLTLLTGYEKSQPIEQPTGINNPFVALGISYYQGAASIYKKGINAWSDRNNIPVHTVKLNR